MVCTILISIVFIAELIIAVSIIQNLKKIDKSIVEINKIINDANPKIKEVCCLAEKISEQMVELSEDFVFKFKEKQEDIAIKSFLKILLAILLLKINSKTINSFRKSETGKFIIKGLSMLENMV